MFNKQRGVETTIKDNKITVKSYYYDSDPAYQQAIFDAEYAEYLKMINGNN